MERQERILIIDDSPVQAERLKSILQDDYAITLANTAEMGLKYAREGDFDLVLLDVVMPEMDGFVLLPPRAFSRSTALSRSSWSI